jgi:hypothetical protein
MIAAERQHALNSAIYTSEQSAAPPPGTALDRAAAEPGAQQLASELDPGIRGGPAGAELEMF